MGWSSGNRIFDPIADILIRSDEDEELKTEVLSKLIKSLQDNDWDTEDESVERYMAYPFILNAFRENEVRIPCTCKCCEHEERW